MANNKQNIQKQPELKAGYKHTKLGWIPEEWEVKKISDLSKSITSGSTPLRSVDEFFKNGNVSWVKTTDLNNGDISISEEKITQLALDKTSIRILPIDTVLVAMYGGYNQIGRTGLLKIESGINQALSAIQTNEKVLNPEYLIDWLNYGVGYWKRYAASSRKDPNITKKDVQDYIIAVGTIPEQKAIATCLITWDKAIDLQTKRIKLLEKRKKGLMQQLLTGKKRLPGFSGEWVEVMLGDLGLIQTGNTPSKKDASFWNGNYNWATANDMENKYIYTTKQHLSKLGYSNARIAKKNSVLVTCIASIGKNALTKIDTGFNQQINSITPNENFNVEFVYYIIDYNPEKLLAFAGAGAMPMLNKNTFMGIKFNFPNLEEQNAIANILQTSDKEIELEKVKLEKLKEEKKGLMQQLLTGKKRLKY